MPLPTERRRPRVQLTVASRTPARRPPDETSVLPSLPGVANGLVAGLVAALAGWLIVTALCLMVWFTVVALPILAVLRFSSQVWLSGLGAGARLGDQVITLIPLGLTLAQTMIARTATLAALRRTDHPDGDDQPDPADPKARWLTVAGVILGHGLVAALIGMASGSAARVLWAGIGGVVVAGIGGASALLASANQPRRPLLPPPLGRLPRATTAGLAGAFGYAALLVAVAVVLSGDRIDLLERSVGFDLVGQVAWVLLVIAFLPNLMLWAFSYSVGAGFSVGAGTVASPWLAQVGLLPAVPILGAVPTQPLGPVWPWVLLVGVVAVGGLIGRIAAVPGSLPGRLTGAAAAAVTTAVALILLSALARGDLGVVRLTGMGPRLPALSWLAPLPLLLGALAAAVIPQRPTRSPAGDSDDTEVLETEATAPLGR